tara:strand:- start:5011 stop:6213 length:1203 start_codon:yes stop_codon:yes gene_type:complete
MGIAGKVRKKEYLETNVYDEALERTRYIYANFDEVVVSFSGGKDSTAVLNTTLQVARELGKLPLKVIFFDEEVIHPPTIDYVRRVSQMEDIDLHWYCLQLQERNGCSNEEPYWYSWDDEKEDLWVRPLPPEAITSHPKFIKGMSFQQFCLYLFDRRDGKVAMLTGIRTEESLRRYQVIAKKKNDCYINSKSEGGKNQYRAFPIYDWSSKDVWRAVTINNWDYNRTYDVMNQTKLFNSFLTQRVCPPYGIEPIRGLWIYAECFPEMWDKMLARVKGVATAWRYGNTELYSNASKKPEHITFKQYMNVIIDSYNDEYQKIVKKVLNNYIKNHMKQTFDPIPEDNHHPVTGVCYMWLCMVAIKGDFKGRQSNTLRTFAQGRREKMGISDEQALKIYGKPVIKS